ncbi:MAG: hypothetical protein M1549_03905 [Candidatus Dependentiae bacterium]|nr:hypothetical protein [Candidatus Dependentiae bacterium]
MQNAALGNFAPKYMEVKPEIKTKEQLEKALEDAIDKKKLDQLKPLICAYGKSCGQNHEGKQPLIWLLDRNYTSIIQMLDKTYWGHDYIQKTIKEHPYILDWTEDQATLQLLIDAGADIQAKSKFDSSTYLHDAASRNNLRLVHFFVKKGVMLDVLDWKGKTALQIAQDLSFPTDIFDGPQLQKEGDERDAIVRYLKMAMDLYNLNDKKISFEKFVSTHLDLSAAWAAEAERTYKDACKLAGKRGWHTLLWKLADWHGKNEVAKIHSSFESKLEKLCNFSGKNEKDGDSPLFSYQPLLSKANSNQKHKKTDDKGECLWCCDKLKKILPLHHGENENYCAGSSLMHASCAFAYILNQCSESGITTFKDFLSKTITQKCPLCNKQITLFEKQKTDLVHYLGKEYKELVPMERTDWWNAHTALSKNIWEKEFETLTAPQTPYNKKIENTLFTQDY